VKLYHKLVLAILPVLVVSMGGIVLIEAARLDRLWRESLSYYLRTLVSHYQERYPQRLVDLLESSGFSGVPSFEEAYRNEAILALADAHTGGSDFVKSDSDLIVYDTARETWYGVDSPDISRDWISEVGSGSIGESGSGFNKQARVFYAISRFEPWSWLIIATVPDTYLKAELRELGYSSALVGLIAWVLATVTINLMIRSLVARPLARMEAITKEIADVTDLGLQSPGATDELSKLELVIRGVGETVRAQKRLLQQANDGLEERVRRQTEELRQKNRTLQEEIDRRASVENDLRTLVAEKDLLVREVHHRVKNNLAMIYSLIQLQITKQKPPEFESELTMIQTRIETMALIHKQLYLSDTLDEVDSAAYFEELVEYLAEAFHVAQHNITFQTSFDPIRLDHVTARTCGLVVNELITNAVIHAFPDGRDGIIRVSVTAVAPDRIALAVSDNGVGLPSGDRLESKPSLGTLIIESLADQLKASVEISRVGGTTYLITFLTKGTRNGR